MPNPFARYRKRSRKSFHDLSAFFFGMPEQTWKRCQRMPFRLGPNEAKLIARTGTQRGPWNGATQRAGHRSHCHRYSNQFFPSRWQSKQAWHVANTSANERCGPSCVRGLGMRQWPSERMRGLVSSQFCGPSNSNGGQGNVHALVSDCGILASAT